MHDIRTMRSVATRAGPGTESAAFLQLYRLASERLRLEREVALSLRKKERVEQRLGEIERQMESLRRPGPGITTEARATRPGIAWREITLEY